jgi:undecaprenyl-diphosphatase
MNIFDTGIINFLNDPSHRFLIIDKFMMSVVDYQLLKGGIVFAVIWGLWFKCTDEGKQKSNREQIVATIISCFFYLYLTRCLAFVLPFRVRPIYNPDIHFIAPSEWIPIHYADWSSFPSDHAALFFSLATGILLINKSIGIIVSLYIFFIVCFPRIYLGLHYPTDILAGMLLGIGVCLALNVKKIRCYITKPVMCPMKKAPGLYYACFFLLTFEMGNLFWNVRTLVIKAYKLFFVFL